MLGTDLPNGIAVLEKTYTKLCPIGHAVRGQSRKHTFSPQSGWIHYRALMRISLAQALHFYEIEAQKNHWSVRELERQIGSMLFERILNELINIMYHRL